MKHYKWLILSLKPCWANTPHSGVDFEPLGGETHPCTLGLSVASRKLILSANIPHLSFPLLTQWSPVSKITRKHDYLWSEIVKNQPVTGTNWTTITPGRGRGKPWVLGPPPPDWSGCCAAPGRWFGVGQTGRWAGQRCSVPRGNMVFPHLVGEMSGVVSYGIWGPCWFVIRELCWSAMNVGKGVVRGTVGPGTRWRQRGVEGRVRPCGVIPQKLVVSIYNGRCGCTPQHTSWGDIGVRLRVNVLDTFPWHSWLEFWNKENKY